MNNILLKLKENYLLLILLWLGAMLIFAYSWVPGGLDVDSCNYAVVAKEIARTNNWLGLYDPVYGGVFYYHFPLCIWVTALFFKAWGVSTFTAKLFAMGCGLGLVAALFYFGRFMKNKWVGFFAGLSFLLTNHILRLSRQCRMDIPVTLFITLAIFSFVLAQRRDRRYYLLFGIFTSLAIMSKDIFGLAPLGIVFFYLIVRMRWKELINPWFLAGIILAIGPVALWARLDHYALIDRYFRWNFLHLLNSSSFKVPWHYYITAIQNKYFYFLGFAIYGGYLAIKEARRQKQYDWLLLVIWAVIFPLAFSFGKQKLHYFILPMYPATALLVGLALDRIFKEAVKIKIVTVMKYLAIIASVILLGAPLPMRSKRFLETVQMAPLMDSLLKQVPEYEFISYKQDNASLLFYSQELVRVRTINRKEILEEALRVDATLPRFCYLSQQDFDALDPALKTRYRIMLRCKDIIFIAEQSIPAPVITLSYKEINPRRFL